LRPPLPAAPARRPTTNPERSRAAFGVDQALDVLDLALERERLHLGRVAATATVVVDHRAVLGEQLRQLLHLLELAVAESAADEDDCRTRAVAVVGDAAAVL
jgi:hypothetical protein